MRTILKMRTKAVTYDRIEIRMRSNYWNGYSVNHPPMAYDSYRHVLTIYGRGVKECKQAGIDIEQECEYFVNHEVLHDVIMNTYDKERFLKLDISKYPDKVHWPFYWGLDLLGDMWFASGIFRMTREYNFHTSPSMIQAKMLL
jgi:hypothetical protein